MTKTLQEFAQSYSYDGTDFRSKSGRNSGAVISLRDLQGKLYQDCNLELEEIPQAVNDLKNIIILKKKIEEERPSKDYKTAIIESKIFDNFVKIDKSGTSVIYERRNNRLHLLDSVGALSNWDNLIFYLRDKESPLIEKIGVLTKPYLRTTKDPEPSNEACIKYLLSKVELFDVITNKIPEGVKVYPSAIENFGLTSLYYIPFKQEQVTINSLNNYLKSLLLNIKDHEYLCAIFWGIITGHDYPYVVYLRGAGGDGKSSFIDMLGRICGGSIATFQNTNQFSIAAMANNTIIHVSENNNPHLLSDKLIKTLTGGNVVSVEGKGKTPYSDIIRSIIIVDSNHHLKLKGEDYEFRRVRYHEIEAPKVESNELLLKDNFVLKLLESKNEFLNYCRQCFEKHSTRNGAIKTPLDHEDTINSLIDSGQKYVFNKFLQGLLNDKTDPYEFRHSASVSQDEILFHLQNELNKRWDQYTSMRFDTFMRLQHKVEVKGGYYIGFGLKPKPTEKFGLSEED
jgi:hypothetical protein